MLMLVVVIIIAAVVSGFAGGMIGTGNQKAPTLMMDVKIVNMGSWAGSGFFASVTAVSEPIPTKDLKIVTSWTTTDKAWTTNRPIITGGNTTLPGVMNIDVLGNPDPSISSGFYVAPFGGGPGINGSATVGSLDTNTQFSGRWQQFGNYTLMPGTTLSAQPCGAASLDSIGGSWADGKPSANYGYGVERKFIYRTASGTPYLDPISAVLGPKWESLVMGDTVNVKVIHIPTGKVIFQQDIPVTEA
jgi:FlaG/FlaF family flagellin (archaellin)